jgi:hypothetical protein
MMANRVRQNITVQSLYELTSQLTSDEIIIPDHQREYCWNDKKQKEFIHTIMEGMPTQSIIMRRVGMIQSLEDGRQRLTTGQRFLNNEFKTTYQDSECFFNELPIPIQQSITNYQMAVITYSNATSEQVVSIFDRFQNGVPLSIGERFHSMTEISPIVSFAKKMLLSDQSPFFERVCAVFGNRSGNDPRRNNLTNAMGIIFGLAFGTEHITKDWKIVTEHNPSLGGSLLTCPFRPEQITDHLRQLLEIYEEVNRRCPDRKKTIKNAQWQVGITTGYIIHSLTKHDALPYDTVKERWVEFLVDSRRDKSIIKSILHGGSLRCIGWTYQRWEMGFLRVFDPEEAIRRVHEQGGQILEEEDDSSDQEE